MRRSAALAGLEIEQATEAAGLLAEAEVIEPGEPCDFVHPLVRSAVYNDLPGARRAAMHHRTARALHDDGAPPSAVAAHLLRAPHRGEGWVVAALREAARGALDGADCPAARSFLERGLREPPDRGERRDLLLELAGVERRLGLEAAVGHAEEAVRLSPAGPLRAEALLVLGNAHYSQQALERAADAYENGVEQAREEDLGLALRLESEHYSVAALLPNRVVGLSERLTTAIGWTAGRPLDAPARSLLAAAALHGVLMCQPKEAVIELVDRATADGQLRALDEVEPNAIYSISGALSSASEPERSNEILTKAIDVARERGDLMAYASASYCRIFCNYQLGPAVGGRRRRADGPERALAGLEPV